MSQISSYSSIYALGHRAVEFIFSENVSITEKVDGSQISFQLLDNELIMRSRGQQLIIDAPEKMFNKAIETGLELKASLIPGWIYRGEYLAKSSHNVIAYDRVPNKYIILFDIDKGNQTYLSHSEIKEEAKRLGLEVVPELFNGRVDQIDQLKELLQTRSILGGALVEGIVIKNYSRFGIDKKVLMAKLVSDLFKEVHAGEWKAKNPTASDIVDQLITKYKTEARNYKAVQHLRENGILTDSPKDIGALIKEIPDDIEKECSDEIKDLLFEHFWPKIKRGLIAGIPIWYKEQLLKLQFKE